MQQPGTSWGNRLVSALLQGHAPSTRNTLQPEQDFTRASILCEPPHSQIPHSQIYHRTYEAKLAATLQKHAQGDTQQPHSDTVHEHEYTSRLMYKAQRKTHL